MLSRTGKVDEELVRIQMYIEFGLNAFLGKLFGDKLPDFEQILGIL